MFKSALTCCLLFAAIAWCLPAGEAPDPDALPALEREAAELREEERRWERVLALIGRKLERGVSAELDAARDEVLAARRAIEDLEATTGLPDIDKRLQVALDQRNAKTDELLADNRKWQGILARHKELDGLIGPLEELPAPGPEDLQRLADLLAERDHLQAAIDRTYDQWRHTPEVEPFNKALWEIIIEEERPAKKAIEGYKKAGKRLRKAEGALRDLLAAAAAGAEVGAWAEEKRAAAVARREEVEGEIDALYTAVLGKDPRWHQEVKLTVMHKGKEKEQTVSLWLPPDVDYVRGIILCDRIVVGSKLAKSRRIRYAAARNQLAIVLQFDAVFKGEQAPAHLQDYLGKLAAQSGHPELDDVPFLTVGHSTGGIFARNVAYWRPDRVLGIIHIKSGNMHQHLRPERQTLAGVPFLAINGEFEQYGPEGGGKGGIRPQWQKQTQWVMIREQMLRRRREDPDNLMGLLYDVGGHHTSWNSDMTRFCARFIHKAAAARLPEPPADPDTEVTCRPLTAADGWLVDADLKDPRYEPAPHADYAGDKTEAFWYFDEELARWASEITGESLIPDPSHRYPVPQDWP